jgi:hypothetical protein
LHQSAANLRKLSPVASFMGQLVQAFLQAHSRRRASRSLRQEMLMKKRLLVCLALVACVSGLVAILGLPKTQAAVPLVRGTIADAKVDSAKVDIHFIHHSSLRVTVLSDKLEFDTNYGLLILPVRDIRSIEFGLRIPEGEAAKVHSAMAELANPEFRRRDKAQRALVELGPYAYPAMRAAHQSKDLETARRAKEVLTQLERKFAKKELKITEQDKVVTRSFTVTGRIRTATVRVHTDLFGNVELPLAKMDSWRAVAGAAQGDVMIDAAQYAIPGKWLETSFYADGRSTLMITAQGMVDVWPEDPNQYVCGPNGTQGGRVGAQGGAGILQTNGGALFGRIGEDGEIFFIGERFQGVPEDYGKLYLTIAPSPWQCASTGAFDVKITSR